MTLTKTLQPQNGYCKARRTYGMEHHIVNLGEDLSMHNAHECFPGRLYVWPFNHMQTSDYQS